MDDEKAASVLVLQATRPLFVILVSRYQGSMRAVSGSDSG